MTVRPLTERLPFGFDSEEEFEEFVGRWSIVELEDSLKHIEKLLDALTFRKTLVVRVIQKKKEAGK